jgi:hypothetical protein
MPDSPAMTAAQDERGMRILHTILGVGVALVIAVFILLLRLVGPRSGHRRRIGPYVPAGSARPIVAYVSSALGAVAVLSALLVFRPLARGRLRAAPAEHPWTNATRGPAILVWLVAESGAIVSSLGLLLTGSMLPAAVAALGFVTLLWCSPGRLSAP